MKKTESDCKTQIQTTKTQIFNINARIAEREKWLTSVIKKNNYDYMRLWDSLQNDLTSGVDNVMCVCCASISVLKLVHPIFVFQIIKIDYFIHEYIGIDRAQLPCEKLTVPFLPLQKHMDKLVLDKPSVKMLESNSYQCARDKALNKLLLDFCVKNSSFVWDSNLNKSCATSSIENLSYAYNALNALRLNEEKTWNDIRLKFKPFVKCAVCNSQVNWDRDIVGNSNGETEHETCTNSW